MSDKTSKLESPKSKFSYYYANMQEQFSVCANFLTGQLTVFRGRAFDDTLETLRFQGTANVRGRSLLENAGYYCVDTSDEIKRLTQYTDEAIVSSRQLSMIIFVTEECNFRCTYCCQVKKPKVLDINVQEKILQFIEENISRFDRVFVEWFGGEPLLYPDIIESLSKSILTICQKNSVIYTSHITTNGYCLDAQMVYRLRKVHVFSYQVTLDGERDSHNSQRRYIDGKGTWDTIVRNLQDIRDNCTLSTISVMIRTNITRKIYEHHESYIHFLYEQFSADRRFHFLWKLAEDWGNISDKTRSTLCGIKEYTAVVSAANKLYLRTRFLKSTLRIGGRLCDAGKRNHLIIMPDGTISKCARGLHPELCHVGTIKDLVVNPESILNITLKSARPSYLKCESCAKLPLCLAQVCPMEPLNNCGYELDNIDFVLESIARTDESCVHVY